MLRRALNGLYSLSGILAAFFLFLIGASIFAQMVGRFFGYAVDATEFSGFSMAASSFLGLAYALRNGAHVRVDILLQNLPLPVQRVLEILCCFAGALFVGYATWCAVTFTLESHEYGDLSPGLLAAPLWIPQTGMSIGLGLLTLALVDDLVVLLRGGMPSYLTNEHASLE